MADLFGMLAFVFMFVHMMCAIGMFLALSERTGFFLALILTFCTGGLATYLWGWLMWKSESKVMVMLIWTGALLGSNIFGYLSQSAAAP